MIVAILGVFTAQTLTVLLSICFILLSAAVLVLVLGAVGDQQIDRSAQLLALQPAYATAGVPGSSLRSLIARQTAAPPRAPPTFCLRQRWISPSGLVPRE
jgi:hypothetical protein